MFASPGVQTVMPQAPSQPAPQKWQYHTHTRYAAAQPAFYSNEDSRTADALCTANPSNTLSPTCSSRALLLTLVVSVLMIGTATVAVLAWHMSDGTDRDRAGVRHRVAGAGLLRKFAGLHSKGALAQTHTYTVFPSWQHGRDAVRDDKQVLADVVDAIVVFSRGAVDSTAPLPAAQLLAHPL